MPLQRQQSDHWLHFENIFQAPHADLFQLLTHMQGISYDSEEGQALTGRKVNKSRRNFHPDY